MTITEILTLIGERTNTQNTTTSSYPTTSKTRDINLTLDNYFILANQFSGNLRPADDTNHADYPTIFIDLISGQQDYTVTVDAEGNQILDIYRVRLLQPDGVTWKTLTQIDQSQITDEQLNTTTGGTPTQYYINANGFFLVQKPNYNKRLVEEGVSGIEISPSRSPYHFTAGDVSTGTKVAGIPWVHHEYLALRPSYFYCLEKGLPQAVDYRVRLYGNDGNGGMENDIKKYWANRNKAVPRRLAPLRQDNK